MSLQEAREKALELHNKYRSRHQGTPPLRLADDLNEEVSDRYSFLFDYNLPFTIRLKLTRID